MSEIKRTTMECHEGGSNKDYTIWIEPKGDGFIVPFLFGAIGGTKQSGCKTPKPVSLEAAEKVLEKVVKEKLAKGYTIGGNVPAYSQVEGKVDAGVRPMLLTEAHEDEDLERLIDDYDWAAQPKLNGLRLLVIVKGGKVTAINRKGLERAISVPMEKALSKLRDCLLDGEKIGELYYPFDLLEEGTTNLRESPMLARVSLLQVLIKGADVSFIRPVETVGDKQGKQKLADNLRAARKEGVVFKRLNGIYEPGRRENLKKAIAVKVKFLKDLSAVVKTWNGGKASIELVVFDEDKEVSIGNCTVPKKYTNQIKPGAVVNVRYLYATADDQLFQPRLSPTDDGIVVREDLRQKDCKFTQLIYEGKQEEVE